MTTEEDADFERRLEERGEPTVRAMLKTREWGTHERAVVRWLERKDDQRSREKSELERRATDAAESGSEHARRAANAAEESLDHAKRSADAAEKSADVSRRALIVSVIAVLVAIFAAVISLK